MRLFLSFALTWTLFTSITSGEDIRNDIAVVTTPAEDYLATYGSEFDVEGGGYSTCQMDLNEDGLLDQLFANAATSGTGGRVATVYLARKDGKFTRIGSLGHGMMVTETIKTGGKLLHCSWSFGGGSKSITTYLISHDGLKEIMTIGSDANDVSFQKLFDEVFKTSLKPDYRFVAARPKSKASSSSDNP
ncbi:hypothetical protein SAMN02745166_04716 [Prosthecobacter debontii]|uniref:Uncharacterized protein n=1 Tax=Prosthecobacter debontii TaxID=48467 RepID=A0A1T4Z0G2_9BACT|nr:hypothetical protein [Prosthecobacter debontii]SKB07512.1 hypothetical protein SAMN02745166_04716 [Prosthecobacter debontii]